MEITEHIYASCPPIADVQTQSSAALVSPLSESFFAEKRDPSHNE
jgi:hypothetical protein